MTPEIYKPTPTPTPPVLLTAPGSLQTAAQAAPSIQWDEVYFDAIMDGATFLSLDVKERPALLGSFLRAGDLGFIYAPRGVGKTWMGLLMANAVSLAEALGEWTAGDGPRRVCYVDGEVNLPDAIERAKLVNLSENVHWIHHETFAEASGQGINLADPVQQSSLLKTLQEKEIDVLFLDNLSCLFRGVSENEADAWELVLPWLMELRRNSITVIIVAHAGRNKEMRGTSRREDAAHWILKLEPTGDSESTGAEFRSVFTKNRNARQAASTCPPLVWKLHTEGDTLTVTCERRGDVESLADLVNGGITTARDLAEELGVSKGTVSKWAKKAAERGLIVIENRCYKAAA